MDNHNGKYSRTTLFVTFVGGAVVGATHPQSHYFGVGKIMQDQLEDYAKRKQQDLIKKAKEVRAALDEVIERGKSYMTEKRAGSEAAVTPNNEGRKETVVARIK